MPTIRYIGGYVQTKVEAQIVVPTCSNPQENADSSELFREELFQEEEQQGQTFPVARKKIQVVRQQKDDLTCGLRCLQNMYGECFVDKEEMDQIAGQLQDRSYGIELYNPTLGFYAMEVLEAVLQKKGKWVQRIDINKISPQYYIPVVTCNPTFTGYIITLGTGTLKHYVAIRFSGSYRKIDSMPGVDPCQIKVENLLKKRNDGLVYCSDQDKEPVVAVSAVGGSPFVEYNILHSSWSDGKPDPHTYRNAITRTLDSFGGKGLTSEEKDWCRKWQRSRVMPPTSVLSKLDKELRTFLSLERDVIVDYQGQRTIIRCQHLEGLLANLKTMGWPQNPDRPFTFVQDQYVRYNSDEPGTNTIDWSETITIAHETHPQIGGFYTFHSSVSGVCTEKQEGTYSVRDAGGHNHILLKKSVSNIVMSSK
jgi:hypothetical protein